MSAATIRAAIAQAAQAVCDTADEIFDAAEPGYAETRSSEALLRLLEAHGFAAERGLNGIPTAFRATFGAGQPVIALLAEYDALAGLSQVAGAVEKQPVQAGAPGHGCGHHLLGAGCAAAAIAIAAHLRQTGRPGTIAVYGCPAEEGGFSKAFLVRDGLFQNVDFALGWHPYPYNGIFAERSLANYHTLVRFYGYAAHASICPEKGRSALDAAELLHIGLNYLREHVPDDTRIHYAYRNAGGTAPNVVPAMTEEMYELRSPRVDDLREIQARFLDIARGAALMTGTRMEYQITSAVAGLLPNRTIFTRFLAHLAEVEPEPLSPEETAWARALQSTMESPERSLDIFLAPLDQPRYPAPGELYYNDVLPMPAQPPLAYGSTDVGDVSMVCPTGLFCTNTWILGTEGHSWQATAQGKSGPAKRAMLRAAEVLARTAADLIDDPAFCTAAREEFQRRAGDTPFTSLLPPDLQPHVS